MAGSNTEPQATPPEPSAPGAAAGTPPSSHPFVIQPRHDVTLSGSAAKAIEDALAAMLVTPEPAQDAPPAAPAPRPVPAAPSSEPLVTFVPPAPYLPPPTRFGAPPARVPEQSPAAAPEPEPEADMVQAESGADPSGEPDIVASPAPVESPPRRAAKQPDPAPEAIDEEPDEPPAPIPPPRTPLGEILVPYMAALVAVLALGLAVYLELQNRARDEQIASQIAALKTAIDALPSNPTITGSITQLAPQPLDFPTNDGTIDALLALQKRVNALEQAAANAPAISTEGLRLPKPLGDNTAAATATPPLDGPTTDCIPIDTRFVALPGEPYPICRTPEVVKLSDITGDTVLLDGGTAPIVEGGFQRLGFSGCTLLVISADVEGFAELRVTCG